MKDIYKNGILTVVDGLLRAEFGLVSVFSVVFFLLQLGLVSHLCFFTSCSCLFLSFGIFISLLLSIFVFPVFVV